MVVERQLRADDIGEPLCCCEYKNVKGEKSHVLAVLCDCEAVDDTCDRFIKCQPVPVENFTRVWEVACDRLRIPWCLGGARRIDEVTDVTALPPVFVIPLALYVASLHYYLTVLVLVTLPLAALLYFRQVSRLKIRTRFFYSWGLVSVVYLGVIFFGCVVPLGHVTEFELAGIAATVLLMFVAFFLTKRDPGIIRKSDQTRGSGPGGQYDELLPSRREGTSSVSRACGSSVGKPGDKTVLCEQSHSFTVNIDNVNRDNWCEVCRISRPPRAGHCKVCRHCVRTLDHHCVWIDSCIGAENHRSFLCSLLLIIVAGVWGSYVSLQSICTYQTATYIPQFDCRHAYEDQQSALIFASVLYTSAVVIAFAALFLQQSYLVCSGITYREYRYQDYTFYSKKYVRNLANFVLKRKSRNPEIEI